MKKRCLLIGAPDAIILKGVQKDIASMYQFLRSNTGGAWEDNEIIKIENPPKNELQGLLQENKYYDFVFILFSGHGGTSPIDKKGYACVNEKEEMIRIDELVNKAEKEIVIFDSCRSPLTSPFLKFSESMEAVRALRTLYRSKYEQKIEQAEKGFILLFASSYGEPANQTDDGGIFTQSLINAGTLVKNGRKNLMDINEAFLIAKEDVKAKYNQQNPDKACAPVGRNTWFPFALKIDLFHDFS